MNTNEPFTSEMKELCCVLSKLNTEKESQEFLRDLCTISELKSLSERWKIAKMLKNKTSYRAIAKETGASTATVTRVAHWLHHGTGGYQLMLERLK
ncbi:MAG: YerC/YecD family TrpR-related protein [Candidatus Gracilibacteria bacterium]|nr:YerC/YecD family TrpR-related protein [Candidatus Gracilibacteria bacterium]